MSGNGESIFFLRSSSGTDRRNALWVLDTATEKERLLADPSALRAGDQVSAEEQARRERARERGSGITGYSTDQQGREATFALSGRLFVADVETGRVRELPACQPAADPRLDPDGHRIAYLCRGALRLIEVDGSGDRALVEPERESITWGAAEFIAAEEMGRHRGYWWSPDGSAILAAGVDETAVQRWFLGDPADPTREPTAVRYPVAGSDNAEVTLTVLGLGGSCVDVQWDREAFPYLVTVHWSAHGSPLLLVQSRNQRTQLVLAVDPDTGATREIHRDSDPHWLEIKPGWPAWTPGGQLVRISAEEGAYRLVVGDRAWTSAPLQVRAVLDVGEDILVSASEEPTQIHLCRVGPERIERITCGPGVHTGTRGGPIMVIGSADLSGPDTRVRVSRDEREIAEISSHADTPGVTPNIELLRSGERGLRSALLLPTGYRQEHGPLPVLLDPYGGPQAQRVLARQQGFLTCQWLADQGFAVVVTDGRGMTGRGPGWDRAIAGDFAGPTLDDQVDALHALAEQRPELDLSRVGIRGWSFGGYLAALAVLRRPDVFHAAIAGAPVCDWRLYDTHYTERYLGDPRENPGIYEANSLLRDAPKLTRPLLLIHGMIDDNVVPAHSLRLSAALTAAARAHTLLPLPGVSHMPTDETTTENLLLLQVEFLSDALK